MRANLEGAFALLTSFTWFIIIAFLIRLNAKQGLVSSWKGRLGSLEIARCSWKIVMGLSAPRSGLIMAGFMRT